MFLIYKWLSVEHLVMFADDTDVVITDIDVGALQNKVDQVIIVRNLVSKE